MNKRLNNMSTDKPNALELDINYRQDWMISII